MSNDIEEKEDEDKESEDEDGESEDEDGESVFYPWEVDGYDSDETDT